MNEDEERAVINAVGEKLRELVDSLEDSGIDRPSILVAMTTIMITAGIRPKAYKLAYDHWHKSPASKLKPCPPHRWKNYRCEMCGIKAGEAQ